MAELVDLCSPDISDQLTEVLRNRVAPLRSADEVTDYLATEEATLLLRSIHVANRSRLAPGIIVV